MAIDRQQVVGLLRHLGYEKAADDAASALPESVSMDQVRELADRHHITHDELISRMGGSP